MSTIFNKLQTTYQPVQQAPVANQATKPNEELTVKQAMAAKNVGDTYEPSAAQPTKKGKGINGLIANIKTFFATIGEYTKGTVKGVAKGVAAGSVVYAGGSVINHMRTKAAEKIGEEAVKNVKKLPNKALAVAVGVVALGINLWKASLNLNEKRSDIHHRWIGH